MIWEYTKATGNYEKQWIDSMDMEMKFWENNRTIAIGTHKLFLYKVFSYIKFLWFKNMNSSNYVNVNNYIHVSSWIM